jgi:uncharacterized protein YpmB
MLIHNLLADIISSKIDRQIQLNSIHDSLDELNSELSFIKFFKWFGIAYFWVKQYTTLLLGIVLLLVSVYAIAFPSSLLQRFEVKEQIIMAVEQSEDLETAKQAIVNFTMEYLHSFTRITGIALFGRGIALLYVSRLTRKMKTLSLTIRGAQDTSKEIIETFKRTIKEEEAELVKLQEMIKSSRI